MSEFEFVRPLTLYPEGGQSFVLCAPLELPAGTVLKIAFDQLPLVKHGWDERCTIEKCPSRCVYGEQHWIVRKNQGEKT